MAKHKYQNMHHICHCPDANLSIFFAATCVLACCSQSLGWCFSTLVVLCHTTMADLGSNGNLLHVGILDYYRRDELDLSCTLSTFLLKGSKLLTLDLLEWDLQVYRELHHAKQNALGNIERLCDGDDPGELQEWLERLDLIHQEIGPLKRFEEWGRGANSSIASHVVATHWFWMSFTLRASWQKTERRCQWLRWKAACRAMAPRRQLHLAFRQFMCHHNKEILIGHMEDFL